MSSDTSFRPLVGGCQCGRLRFRLEAAPIITHCCHCRDCQRGSGSAFRINTMIETRHLTVIEGESVAYAAADGQEDVRCAACGSSIWSYHSQFGTAIAFVGVGLLDEGERLAPEAHYFTRSKHPWITLPAGVPSFEQLGSPGKPGVRERIAAEVGSNPKA